MLFKQFSTCNEKQCSPRLTKIPRFPGKGRRFHLSTGNAPVRIVASPGAYSRFSRRGRDISTILDVRTRSRREELTQRRVENDERTNERSSGVGGRGKTRLRRPGKVPGSCTTQDVGERTRETKRKRWWKEREKARTADVGTSVSGTVGCEGRNRSPALLPRGWAKWNEWVESRNRMESKGDAKLVCSDVLTLFFHCLRKCFLSDAYVAKDSFRQQRSRQFC